MLLSVKDITAQEKKVIEGMLSALGRLPSSAPEEGEETPLSPEERLAAFLLEEVRLAVLSQGWHFNTVKTANAKTYTDVGFDKLPPLFHHYVVVKATRRLQDRLMVSPTLHAFTEREEQEAYAHLKMWNSQNEAPNMLEGLNRR